MLLENSLFSQATLEQIDNLEFMDSVINLDSQAMRQTVQVSPGKTVICFYMNPGL